MFKGPDAIVVGSGPNGLAAAIKLAQAGLSVEIYEAKDTIGGGTRSGEITLPGFTHDLCSAIHPLGVASPFFRTLPLENHGLKWIFPPIPLAHPFDKGSPALLQTSIQKTEASLKDDLSAYEKIIDPLVANWDKIESTILGPLAFPNDVWAFLRFASKAIFPAKTFSKKFLVSEEARSLFLGLALHALVPHDRFCTASFGLVLAILAHKIGWPLAQGGSQKIADALASYFISLGGKIITGMPIHSYRDLPTSNLLFFDLTPRQFVAIMEDKLSFIYRKRLLRYRYGPGVFKVDWALSHPIPWKDPECLQAGTLHLGGTSSEMEASEKKVWEGCYPKNPYVILSQPSLFDPSRAPQDKHTAWGYCHVPHGSSACMVEAIESQVERFAPGFKDCILARSTRTPMEFEKYNPNYVGGDINGGVQDLFQLFTRPIARIIPYSTPLKGVYLCSSSTPPGGGVHGMCGYHAALAALKKWA